MCYGLFGFIFIVLSVAIPVVAEFQGPVRIDSGQIIGIPGGDKTITAFKGIPYAAPPVGELRWRPPQPVVPWQGVRRTDHFGAHCMQHMLGVRLPWTTEFMAQGLISENCLFLNVWTGAASASERRPVLVFIHGGGMREGSGAIPVYDGENLAKKGIVVVTINYRMGVMGLFAHPELTKESEHRSSGNYGLLDQRAALQWVQRNIAAFGGDPKRVTIMGQSAGSRSVHYLVASPRTKGLFHGAIAQSGLSMRPYTPLQTLAQAEESGMTFMQAKGARSLKELRATDGAVLLAPIDGEVPSFQPIVDGWYIPKEEHLIYAEGSQNDVPTMTGLTYDEASSRPGYGKLPVAEFQKQVREMFGPLADEFFRVYPSSTQEESSRAQRDSSREQGLYIVNRWATLRAKTSKTKAYTYLFTHSMPGPQRDLFLSFHTSDVPYQMNNLDKSDRLFAGEDWRIADKVSDYWVNFVKTGDPNGPGLPHWPAFDFSSNITMHLGNEMKPAPVASPGVLQLFEKFLARSGQSRGLGR